MGAFGAFMIANGVAGIVAWDTIYDLYQAKAKLDKTGEAMGKFVQGGFVAIGTYLIRASATSPPSSSSRWWTEWAASTRWAPTSGRRSTRRRRALRSRRKHSIRPPLVSLLALPSGTGWTWS